MGSLHKDIHHHGRSCKENSKKGCPQGPQGTQRVLRSSHQEVHRCQLQGGHRQALPLHPQGPQVLGGEEKARTNQRHWSFRIFQTQQRGKEGRQETQGQKARQEGREEDSQISQKGQKTSCQKGRQETRWREKGQGSQETQKSKEGQGS